MKKLYEKFFTESSVPSQWKKAYKESVENVSITFLKPVQLHNNRAPAYPNGVVPKGTKVIIDLNQHLGMKERWYVPYTGKGFIKQMKVGSRYGIKLNDAVINELKKRGIVKEEY